MIRHLRIGLLFAAACTSGGSRLDGPIDFTSAGGFAPISTILHVELDGQATVQTQQFTDPPQTKSGRVADDALQGLHDDIAAVDLESFANNYNCQDFRCGADAPLDTAVFQADGMTRTIQIDRNISDADLPAGLVKIFNDLGGIANQVQTQP